MKVYPENAKSSRGPDSIQPVALMGFYGEEGEEGYSPVPVEIVSGGGGGGQTDGLTDAQLRATAVPVSVAGEIEVKNDAGNPLAVINAGIGAVGDASATGDTGAFSLIALVKRLLSVKLPASLGAKTSAASFSVVPANDATFAVSGPVTDAQLRAVALPVSVAGEIEVKNDSGNPLPVSSASIETLLGAVDEAAPGSNAAASGLRGALRFANSLLTNIRDRLPASLGAKTGATSVSVVAASDGFSVAGNVASGVADAGNPVKVGGVFAGLQPTITAGQRGDLQLNPRGDLRVCSGSLVSPNATYTNMGVLPAGDGTNRPLLVSSMVTDGTTLFVARGDATGSFVVGNIASGVADAGNPIKVGAKYNVTFPTFTDGQRSDLQADLRGNLRVTIADAGGLVAPVQLTQGDNSTNSQQALTVTAFPKLYNGIGWDRAKGDTSGAYTAGAQYWRDTSSAQAASATVNGASRSHSGSMGGVGTRFNMFIAEAYCSAAGGTLYVDTSNDGGTTWLQWGSVASAAGTTVSLKAPITESTYRSRFVNGANAQATFALRSAFTTA